jgi:hypothetical protein
MSELDVLSDTEFRARAIEFLDAFADQHAPNRCPVKRAQITGLRQIAFNEPAKVKEFAEHQRTRAAARLETINPKKEEQRQRWKAQVDFWQFIERLCDGRPPRQSWSLAQEMEKHRPEEYKLAPLPAGAKLSREEQDSRNIAKHREREWSARWMADCYPAFFQRFCAHYLYLMSQQPETEEE